MENNKVSQNNLGHSGNKMIWTQLISRILRNWYVFLITAMLGTGLAATYNKYFPRNYKASTAFLLKNEPHQLASASTLENLDVQARNPKVQNELAILSSYSLQVRTLQNLNWLVSWNMNSFLNTSDLYQDEPFRVTISPMQNQLAEIPIIIKPVSNSEYTLTCDHDDKSQPGRKDIKFKARAFFGKPFQNQYFNFILDTIAGKPVKPGVEYKLKFNDLNQLALDYQTRLDVKTTATESDVVTAELKGTNARRNVDYLNALGRTYLEFGLEEKNRIARNKLNFIKGQLTGISDSLRHSGNRFTSFRAKNKIVDLGQEGTQTLKKVEDVQVQETTLKARIDYYTNLKNNLNNEDQLKNIVTPPEAGLTDAGFNSLLLKLSDQLSKRETLANIVQPGNPKMIAANKEIEFTRKVISDNVNNMLANSENELKRLEDQKQMVNARLSDIPKTERDLLSFKRDFDINSQLYDYLLQKSAEAAIALASNDPDAQILDAAAIENTELVGLKPFVNLLIGLFIATIIPLAIIVLKEYGDTRLKSLNYVNRELDLSLAGFIPHNKTKAEIPVIRYPYSAITEAFRNLRTNIQFLLRESKGKLIAVHSPIKGEGKSFISANLASIIAMSGKKVLLIEADFRNARLHTAMKVNQEMGLSDFLKGTASFENILKKTPIAGLTFISAGKNDPRISEWMTTGRLDLLLKEAEKSFDYILIDNSPAEMVSDSKIVASYADINLFVLKMNYSSESELSYINETARQEIIGNMIVVMNDVKENREKRSFGKAGYFSEEEYSEETIKN